MDQSQTNMVLFSVVIPTYHRNDLLAQCLDCLTPGVQTLSADQYEVIVTDDGFQTTAEEMILQCYPWTKWVAGSRQGPAANRNNGAKYAQGEWLAFTDDDCLPDPSWLNAFAAVIDGEALALEGAIHPLGDPNQDLAECPVNLTGGYFWSANIAVQRSLFETIGGFDPSYPLAAFEDQDLQLRLLPYTTILFIPTAQVVHTVRLTTLKEKIIGMPKRCKSLAYHVNKHKENFGFKRIYIEFIFLQYLFHIQVMAHRLLRNNFKGVFVSLVMLTYGIPLILYYIRHHQKVN